jgi:hypothetical protein
LPDELLVEVTPFALRMQLSPWVPTRAAGKLLYYRDDPPEVPVRRRPRVVYEGPVVLNFRSPYQVAMRRCARLMELASRGR